jgi:pyruvate-formate lyase-activating enzyme
LNDSVKKAVLKVVPFKRLLKRGGLMLVNAAHSLRGDAYFCSALSGESDYNICINSDMSVSCNCVDIDGSGHIGDLSVNTLEEIFAGPTATRFRRQLSRGMIPIRRCMTCRELRKISRAEAKSRLSAFTTPKHGIMVENTVQCNLKCVNCSRREILKTRKKLRMSLQDMEKVAQDIKRNEIRAINFFNLGEPFMSDTIREELALLKKYNPDTPIYISTNGALINREEKLEAALLADYVFISLDGATNESVTRYQAGGNFEASYENMTQLVRLRNSRNLARPIVDWKYVVFSWNDSEAEIEKAIALAREAKVDILSFWPGTGTPEQISARFRDDPYFRKLGTESWKGREIDFRKPARGDRTAFRGRRS